MAGLSTSICFNDDFSFTYSVNKTVTPTFIILDIQVKKIKKIATRIAFHSTSLLFKNLQNKKGTAEKYIDNMVF